jgi:hypothetical protein
MIVLLQTSVGTPPFHPSANQPYSIARPKRLGDPKIAEGKLDEPDSSQLPCAAIPSDSPARLFFSEFLLIHLLYAPQPYQIAKPRI